MKGLSGPWLYSIYMFVFFQNFQNVSQWRVMWNCILRFPFARLQIFTSAFFSSIWCFASGHPISMIEITLLNYKTVAVGPLGNQQNIWLLGFHFHLAWQSHGQTAHSSFWWYLMFKYLNFFFNMFFLTSLLIPQQLVSRKQFKIPGIKKKERKKRKQDQKWPQRLQSSFWIDDSQLGTWTGWDIHFKSGDFLKRKRYSYERTF